MESASTINRTDSVSGQKSAHAKTVSRQMAEQFRMVQNPSYDAFRSFARDYISVSVPAYDGNPGIDSLSATEQQDLAHALGIKLAGDDAATTKGFDEFVTELYGLY